MTTRCHSVCSFFCPVFLSFQVSVVATEIDATAVPPGVKRSSASRPRFPTIVALL